MAALAIVAMLPFVACGEVRAAGASVYDVRAFGAAGDGRTKDTVSVQRAVDAAHAAGGGTVEVPAGTYVCGSIFLKSHVDFHVGAGAEIRASADPADYNAPDVCPQNWTSVNEAHRGGHLFLCIEQENVTVRGPGRINGNSRAFLVGPKGERWSQGGIPFRPAQMLYFVESRDVRVQDLELADSSYWSCFFHGCEQVSARGLWIHNVRTGFHTHNGDGIDIDCCARVTVSDCRISTADDCITLRASGRRLRKARDCAYVTVANCVLSSPCNAIRVGVGEGRIHDATFSNIVVEDTRTAVNLVSSWSKESRGVDISRISFSNFRVDAFLFCQVSPKFAKEAEFSDIVFSDVSGVQRVASEVTGNASRAAERVRFRNVDLPCGVFARNVKDFEISGGTLQRVNPSEEELIARSRALDFHRRVMWDETAYRPGGLAEPLHAKIADCDRYAALHPRFAKAFAFMKRPDLATLKPGRYEIDGDNCWAMIQECDLKPYPQEKGEAHRAYIDIQAPITGEETIGVCDLPRNAVEQPFDAARDYALYAAKTRPLTVRPGEFAVFFPKIDLHMPGCTTGKPARIRKLVIKVRN